MGRFALRPNVAGNQHAVLDFPLELPFLQCTQAREGRSIARLPNEEVKLSIAISSRTGMILGYF
jgi:hypothetical protein